MKKSLLALAAVVVLASMSVVTAVADCVHASCDWLKGQALKVFAGPAAAPAASDAQPNAKPRVALRRAGQFVLRVLKREQPLVTPDWRMVPST